MNKDLGDNLIQLFHFGSIFNVLQIINKFKNSYFKYVNVNNLLSDFSKS